MRESKGLEELTSAVAASWRARWEVGNDEVDRTRPDAGVVNGDDGHHGRRDFGDVGLIDDRKRASAQVLVVRRRTEVVDRVQGPDVVARIRLQRLILQGGVAVLRESAITRERVLADRSVREREERG